MAGVLTGAVQGPLARLVWGWMCCKQIQIMTFPPSVACGSGSTQASYLVALDPPEVFLHAPAPCCTSVAPLCRSCVCALLRVTVGREPAHGLGTAVVPGDCDWGAYMERTGPPGDTVLQGLCPASASTVSTRGPSLLLIDGALSSGGLGHSRCVLVPRNVGRTAFSDWF